MRGDGQSAPTLTRLGLFFHHDGMYTTPLSGHCYSVCTLCNSLENRGGGGVNLLLVSATLMVNLPPESLTPVVQLEELVLYLILFSKNNQNVAQGIIRSLRKEDP